MLVMERYTESQEDFLEAMLMLEEEGRPMETTLVAEKLSISKPAVHQMGHELIKKGLITRIDYGPMALTEKGREVAKAVLHRHRVLHEVLTFIGVPEDIAEEDCCMIEHAISETTFRAIEAKLAELKK